MCGIGQVNPAYPAAGLFVCREESCIKSVTRVVICVPHVFSELTLKVSIFLRLQLGGNKIDFSQFYCFSVSCLPEYMETGTLVPLQVLNTNIVCHHPGASDTVVGWSGQSYCNPILYVDARPRVGLFPLSREADGYTFNSSLRLHAKEAVHRYDEGGEVVAFLEAGLQIFLLLLFLYHMENFIGWLFTVVEGFSVHNKHVVNNVYPSLPDIVDQKISLLLWCLFIRSRIVEKGPCRMGIYLPHCMTWIDEDFVPHI